VILPSSFLQEMVDFFDKYKDAAGAGGKVIPKYERGKEPEWMSKYLNGFVGKVDFGNNILQYDEGIN